MDISWIPVERCKKVHTKQPEITVKFTGYDLGKLEERWIVAVNGFFFFHLAGELNKYETLPPTLIFQGIVFRPCWGMEMLEHFC